jgi:hypothetical protein
MHPINLPLAVYANANPTYPATLANSLHRHLKRGCGFLGAYPLAHRLRLGDDLLEELTEAADLGENVGQRDRRVGQGNDVVRRRPLHPADIARRCGH